MVKIISTATLILAIVLFPPSSLALISNNAVPGDATYPIKRILEDGIYAVASLNPITRAWFSAARSDRRFKEFSTLIAQGKSASKTLNELVSQTDIAANELAKVEDPVRKEQLTDQLLDSIKKYDQGLEQASNQITTPPITEVVSPPEPSATLVATPVPTQRPTPSAQPVTPSKPPQGGVDAKEIDEARKKIEEIEKKIKEEKEKSKKEKEHSDKKEQREVQKERNKEDKNDGSGDFEREGRRVR